MATHTGMRVQSVRFTESAWQVIRDEAGRQGISASQYVREAAIARIWLDLGSRPEEELTQRVRGFLELARELENGGS